MKKILLLLLLISAPISFVKAEDLAQNAKSAIIMEYSTGKILFEKNAHEKLAPASMTKIMTMLLTMESIDSGKINMNDMVTISQNASSMGGSQMFLETNSQVKLSELIKGVSIASANDAAVALAEYVGGTINNFVNMMNQKASSLGLNDTHFMNPHGLDAENHYSSAYDMAIIASNLISHNDILNFTSIYEDYFNKPDGSRTWLVNTNKLVRFYKGVDGLKTGYTEQAGYCLTSTSFKDKIRYITVVMGEPTSDLRTKETTSMLNYAFNSFKLNTIIDVDQELASVAVEKSNHRFATIIVKKPITELIPINEETKSYSYELNINKLVAPVNNKDTVGTIKIIDSEGLTVKEEELTVKNNIEKSTLRQAIINNFKFIFSGM